MGFKVMKLKLLFIIIINLSFSIGLDGLNIPTNSMGLISGKSTGIEIQQLNELFNEQSFVEYNSIRWFPGLTGHSIHWKNAKGFVKYVSFNSMSDDEVYLYSEIPNNYNNTKLPASIYSNSIILGKQVFELYSAIEFKSFLSRLYTEKVYGLLGNIYIFKSFKNGIGIESNIQNLGIIKGNIENQQLPTIINLNLNNKFTNLPLSIGLGINYSEKEFKRYSSINMVLPFISIITSISYSEARNIDFAGGFCFKYDNYSLGYSISTPLFDSVKSPQIISLRYKF
jgi:hypothetical protein